jgi:hypothetical protein
MSIQHNLDELERLIHRPVSSRPDWLKHAREDAEELLWLAHRAGNDQDFDRLAELDEDAAVLIEKIERRLAAGA